MLSESDGDTTTKMRLSVGSHGSPSERKTSGDRRERVSLKACMWGGGIGICGRGENGGEEAGEVTV